MTVLRKPPGMQALLALFGLLLMLAAASVGAKEPARRRGPLIFSGNIVLNDEVYLAILDLPADFVPNKEGTVSPASRDD